MEQSSRCIQQSSSNKKIIGNILCLKNAFMQKVSLTVISVIFFSLQKAILIKMTKYIHLLIFSIFKIFTFLLKIANISDALILICLLLLSTLKILLNGYCCYVHYMFCLYLLRYLITEHKTKIKKALRILDFSNQNSPFQNDFT